jgi:tRNA 2-thiouridine synthesizing protein E
MKGGGAKNASASGHRLSRLAGRDLLLDEEGFLLDPRQWSEEAASDMALEQGMPRLEEPHWRVIRFLREYYLAHGKAPLSREIKKKVGMSLLEIEALFPGGLRAGARRIAGLPNPRGCM